MSEANEFIRRKFTLTETDDRELQRLADRHYDGNVSLCLRAAFASHSQNLDGEGQRAVQRLEREVRTLSEQTSQIGEDIDRTVEKTEELATAQTTSLPFRPESNTLSDAESVYGLFRESTDSLRIDDVIERSELPPRRILPAVEFLVDLAYLRRTTQDRYQLLTTADQPTNE